jgi:regulatory protein
VKQRPTPGSSADLQPEADLEHVARTILLRRLTAAPRTRSELRGDLLARGIPEDVADRVLDRFVEVGLIDDTVYSRMWVESRHRSRGSARSVLGQELRRKGVAVEIVDEALSVIDVEAERARAAELVRVKARGLSRLDTQARTRRLVGMLQRRGYPPGLAFSVVRDVLQEVGDEAEMLDQICDGDDAEALDDAGDD